MIGCPRCNATYKTGIEFAGWSDRAGFERYFHPFPTSVNSFTAPGFFQQCLLRRSGCDVPAHPDPFFLPTALARRRLAPIPRPNFPFDASYGYHFDAGLLGQFLKQRAASRGVRHVDAVIADVAVGDDGKIEALVADDGTRFEGDFFIDASGFRAAIIEKALSEPYRPFADNLFNDRAVVVPTPTGDEGPEVCTRSTALSAGWAWRIPLTHRVGNGYVYSSRFIDPDAAAVELRDHLGLPPDSEVRHLQMRVGRIERSWVSNCLAIGLAQGFVEPLEATALHVVLATVDGFVDAVAKGGDETARDTFNKSIARRIEGIRDYIVGHYRAALRSENDYWRACTSNDQLSDSLKQLFTCWFTGGDLVEEIERQRIGTYYSPVSWHCLFGGYGNFPEASKLRPPEPGLSTVAMDELKRFIDGCAMNFPSHMAALEELS